MNGLRKWAVYRDNELLDHVWAFTKHEAQELAELRHGADVEVLLCVLEAE